MDRICIQLLEGQIISLWDLSFWFPKLPFFNHPRHEAVSLKIKGSDETLDMSLLANEMVMQKGTILRWVNDTNPKNIPGIILHIHVEHSFY